MSFVPPASGDVSSIKTADAPAIAFDTGPGNALIDYVANKVSGGKLHMDEDGELAAQGRFERLPMCDETRIHRCVTQPGLLILRCVYLIRHGKRDSAQRNAWSRLFRCSPA